MTSLRQPLGVVIARLRTTLGLSQEDFAYKAKVHRTYMTGIERGSHNPSLDVVERIARVLGMDASDLVRQAEIERQRRAPRK